MKNLISIKFSEAELDVIYDAISELAYVSDDEEILELIKSISDKMYNKSKVE